MGSRFAARRAPPNETVDRNAQPRNVGWYTDRRTPRSYPAPLSAFYPDTGDFMAFVGNVASRGLVSGW